MTVRREIRVDGKDNYILDAVPQSNGTYRVYARLHPPDRHGRGGHHHHLMPGGKICVSAGSEPRTAAAAMKIGKCWAQGWSQYQRTGRFPGS
ncbi:MAG: hypothetical protein KDA93_09645 [Planctomycetaceae bacterium]|nr:hypothetical protein [Planctomycetaceae bacterium]